MRLLSAFFGLLTLSCFAQTPSAAPSAASSTQDATGEQVPAAKATNHLVGKWYAASGDHWEFTATGTFAFIPEPTGPDKNKGLRGAYRLDQNLQATLTPENGAPVSFSYAQLMDTLALKLPSGDWTKFKRLESRGVAEMVLGELRLIEIATDQWSLENAKLAGVRGTFADLRPYLGEGTRLHSAFGDPTGPKDLLGNPFTTPTVDLVPKVHPATFKVLSRVAPREFWETHLE